MLKNYESRSPLPNIFNEIENTLSTHGARQVMRDYDTQGRLIALSFTLDIQGKTFGFRLPARFDKVEQVFKTQGIRYKEDQPYRTAWATIRDWVSVQMALIDWELAKPEEVFLPYAVTPNGQTYFEVIEDRGFLLPEGNK